MERQDKTFPIEARVLGDCALKYHAYAKALHYKELESFTETSPETMEALISVNMKLQQQDAAWGALIIAQEQYDLGQHEEWYEKLGKWQEALAVYDKRAARDPGSPDALIGRMKCLHALGEWDQIAAQMKTHWSNSNQERRIEIAPMAVAAAWSLREWDSMEQYISTMSRESPDTHFYRAILSVHQGQFQLALSHILKSRDLLDPDFNTFSVEGYGSTYK